MVRHFSRAYQNDPVSYIRQQEQINQVISNAPGAMARAAMSPAIAIVNYVTQNKNGNDKINNK